jgi:Dolichyl-phosphate-mannose-protein mannosyltransferase
LPKSERILLWSTAAVSLILRAVAFLNYRFDADEQQHLHVAWGWVDGQVQYRDFFDNHAPLFHLLTAPILALFGERSDILHWMRVPMLLLFAVVVYATYLIGKHLYDERTSLWAAVLVSLFPPFFLKSLEYRTDNLWTALWIVALVLLLRQRSMFLTGLILGCALATSLKTTLLVITIATAALITRLFVKWNPARGWLKFAIGFAIVPAALLIFFGAAGAWDELVYCTVTFNGNVALTRRNLWVQQAIFPFTAAALIWAAWRFRGTQHPWRYFCAVAMGVFTVVLAGFWVLISPRDFLPLMPLMAVFAAAAMTRARQPLRAFAAVSIAFLAGLWYYGDRFEKKTDWHTTMMDQLLRLSHPGEPVIDYKGETIFRRRPFYYVLENITRAQMARGIIKDTIPEDVVRTRTHVAQADGPIWPPRGRAFLHENFIDVGRLRASGQFIKPDGTFHIAIPGEYVIVGPNGETRGTLDGTPYTAARELAAGPHRFEQAVAGEDVCALWAPAFRRGHSPFKLRDREF